MTTGPAAGDADRSVPAVIFRPAVRGDLGMLGAWRNDPETRRHSRRRATFSDDQVARWVFAEGRRFLVALDNGEPVGTVSFGTAGDTAGPEEVSIIVAPERRGTGLGKRLLAKAARLRPGRPLAATIHADNHASRAIFEACGFRPSGGEAAFLNVERPPDGGAARALLLDLDGTIADNLPVMRRALDSFVATLGGVGDTALFDRMNGPPLREVVRLLKETFQAAESVEVLLSRYQATLDALYRDAPPTAGSRDLITAAGAAGWGVAVVTSNSVARAGAWLAEQGLAQQCDVLIGGDVIARGKPFPDPYAMATESFALTPEACIAVEDSPAGARAAVSAGVPTWGYAPEGRSVAWPEGVTPTPGMTALKALLFPDGAQP